ncbi:hypothetical protein C0J52_01024 [Blattella germanica]|nr:hypothetical protein C0J52_01024 [Blattella germanica]
MDTSKRAYSKYNPEWGVVFLCKESGGDAQCLICKKHIITKKCNVKRHYETHHETKYNHIEGDKRVKLYKELNPEILRRTEIVEEEKETTNDSGCDTISEDDSGTADLWGANRTLLLWLKLWDKVVFNREKIVKQKPKDESKKENKFTSKSTLNTDLDEHGCPKQKVALLCGPPGLGKTTLAHMVGAHAGYNVIEVNASDDRSPELFRTQLEAATRMNSLMGAEPRPNYCPSEDDEASSSDSGKIYIRKVPLKGHDIIAFRDDVPSALIVDPTIRYETNDLDKASNVEYEKHQIYSKCVEYYNEKYFPIYENKEYKGSIDVLIKFIMGKGTKPKKKVKGKEASGGGGTGMKRPVICICNDMYVPALRALRQIALIVHFPPTASSRLAQRLMEIARKQKIRTDMGALLALAEKSSNDIRSCLSVLHFFKSQKKDVRLVDIQRNNIGQKDVQKGLFTVWQEIFHTRSKKTMSGMSSNGQLLPMPDLNTPNMKFEMKPASR